MCELAERTAERTVFAVVHWVLEEVSLADFMFAVVAVRLVVMEVDFPEKPAGVLLLAIDRCGIVKLRRYWMGSG